MGLMNKRFYSPLRVKLSFGFIIILIFVAVFADFLAGDFTGAVIKFDPYSISEYSEIYRPPGFQEADPNKPRIHVLGTDKFGRDVAARLIYGTRAALGIGFLSTLISLMIALVLGVLSGYYGNERAKINLLQVCWVGISICFGLFFIWYGSFSFTEDGRYVLLWPRVLLNTIISITVFFPVWVVLQKVRMKKYPIPFDSMVLKLLEVFRSIPTLFLLIASFALIKTPSMMSVIIIIGLLGWPGLTRILRAELQKTKREQYIEASQTLGLSNLRIVFNHLLPNSLAPVFVALAFAISSAVLLESALSFLEIGLPLNTPSWGGLLRESRDYFAAWWLAIIPGMMIFLTVLSCNILGARINQMSSRIHD